MDVNQLMASLARWSYRNPWTVIVISVLITIGGTLLAVRLELRNDFVELLPQYMPQVKTIRQVTEKTGGLGYQMVMVVSPEAPKNRQFLQDLQNRLLNLFWHPPLDVVGNAQLQYERVTDILRRIRLLSQEPDPDIRQHLGNQIEQLDQEAMVEYALHRFDKSFFEQRRLLFLELLDIQEIHRKLKTKIRYEVRRRQPGYVDLLGESDPGLNLQHIEAKYKKQLQQYPDRLEVRVGKRVYSALLIRPRGFPTDMIFSQHFVRELGRLIRELNPTQYHSTMKADYMGGFTANLREYERIAHDLRQSILSTAVLLIILLLAYFRRVRILLWITAPMVVAAALTFGFTYLAIGYLNSVTGFTGSLLLGLGIDYGIYLSDRYLREREDGYSVEDSLVRIHYWTGMALITSATTTAVSFLALMICRFKGFSEFGLIAGMGILFFLVAVLIMLPALVSLTERWRMITRPRQYLPTINQWTPFPLATPIVIVSLIFLGASVWALTKVPFEYNMKKLSYQEDGLLQQFERWQRFEKLFPQGLNPVVFLTQTEEETRKLTAEIERRGNLARQTQRPTEPIAIRGVFSAFTFVPTRQAEKVQRLREIRELLEKNDVQNILTEPKVKQVYETYRPLLDAQPFQAFELPFYLRRDLVVFEKGTSDIFGYVIVINSGMDLSDGRQDRELNALLSGIHVNGKRFDPSGEAIILAELLRVIDMDSLIAILASFLVVALLVWWDLRDFRMTLLAMWPLVSGMLGVMGVMVVLDIRLSLFNMVVLPALLGIGVDAGVHMLHRYQEKTHLGVLGVELELFGPVMMASITTLVSFATMITCMHLGLRSIGTLSVAGLCTILLGTLVFLPALMEMLFRRWPVTPAVPLPEIAALEAHKPDC